MNYGIDPFFARRYMGLDWWVCEVCNEPICDIKEFEDCTNHQICEDCYYHVTGPPQMRVNESDFDYLKRTKTKNLPNWPSRREVELPNCPVCSGVTTSRPEVIAWLVANWKKGGTFKDAAEVFRQIRLAQIAEKSANL